MVATDGVNEYGALVKKGETDMRKPLTLPLLIVIASLVLAITGCGNDDDGGTGEAPVKAVAQRT